MWAKYVGPRKKVLAGLCPVTKGRGPNSPPPFYLHTPLSQCVKEFADHLEIDILLGNHICSTQNNPQLEFLCSFFFKTFFMIRKRKRKRGGGGKIMNSCKHLDLDVSFSTSSWLLGHIPLSLEIFGPSWQAP